MFGVIFRIFCFFFMLCGLLIVVVGGGRVEILL